MCNDYDNINNDFVLNSRVNFQFIKEAKAFYINCKQRHAPKLYLWGFFSVCVTEIIDL